jgi:hypothetical protein
MKDIAVQFVGVCRQVLTEWIYDKPIPTKQKRRVGIKNSFVGPKGALRGYHYKAFKSDKIEWHMAGAGGKLAPKSRRLWTRTGALRRLERFTIIPFHGWAAMITNIANRAGYYYAFRRHWLRHTRFPGMVMAPAPWREEALERTKDYRKQRLAQAVLDAIKAKLA